MLGRFHGAALGTADIGDHRVGGDMLVQFGQHVDVLVDRRRQHDEVRFGHDDRVIGRDVDRMQDHRLLQHLLAVDADHEGGRPLLPDRKGNRAANESEAHDRDLVEERR